MYEALEFSAQMRILDVKQDQLKDFVDQVYLDSLTQHAICMSYVSYI